LIEQNRFHGLPYCLHIAALGNLLESGRNLRQEQILMSSKSAIRKILHLDLDAFFCAVEEQHSPTLHGQPFAVGGRPEERGVVASCSYAARRFGVRSAMPMVRAVKLCPALIIVPHRFPAYREASRKVMTILREMTPLVEQISIDEAFLDVTALSESAEVLARRLQATINRTLNLPCSIGVGTNKLVAKIANNVGKDKAIANTAADAGSPPNAIQVVEPGREAAFLAPLPTRELWGVGPKTAEQLALLGIHTIGDMAAWPEADLGRRFGKNGFDLSRRARGIDDRPIETERETKSVSNETTFTHDVSDRETLRRVLHRLCNGVSRHLRQEGLSGSTIKLKLRWSNFTTLTRQVTLNGTTDREIEIYTAALQLFDQTWSPGKSVRLIGVGVSGFEPPERQLTLWEGTPAPEDDKLKPTLDDLRDKFGNQIVQRGIDLKRRIPPKS
jgi:DNA polymerase-4